MPTLSKPEPHYTKCCYCIPIEIGCFMLGYLNLIIGLMHTIFLITFIEFVMEIESPESPLLVHVKLLLRTGLFMNSVWLVIIVACLVGLHKTRPGSVMIYVRFAFYRHLIMLFGLIRLCVIMPGYTSPQIIIYYCFDIGLALYFTLVYYVYATRLKCEETNQNVVSSS